MIEPERSKSFKVLALLTCSDSMVGENGAWSLSNLYTSFRVPSFPFLAPKMQVYIEIFSEANEPAEFKIYLADKNGASHSHGRITIQSWGETGISATVFELFDCLFLEPGKYSIHLVFDDCVLATRDVLVKLREEAAPDAPDTRL